MNLHGIYFARLMVVGMLLGLCSCAAKTGSRHADIVPTRLSLAQVAVDRKVFAPERGEYVKIRLWLSTSARVAVTLYDAYQHRVRVLAPDTDMTAGYNELRWDGTDDRGAVVPDDVYYYVIEARDPSSAETVVYDRTDDSGGQLQTISQFSFDAQSGTIRYVLPEPGLVRIRVGIGHGGPLLKTVCDWTPQASGEHHVRWDGTDESGYGDFRNNRAVFANVISFSLPDNSIITQANPVPQVRRETSTRPVHAIDDVRCRYARMMPEHRRAPDFFVSMAGELTAERSIPIRVTVADHDKQDLTDNRFEILLFIDQVFLFEEEEGVSPYTYLFDPAGINPGKHILTVNVYGLHDRIAARSILFELMSDGTIQVLP